MPIPGLDTYEPDGAMPWPLVLVEGEEHSGKTYDLVAFAKQCDRIGEVYWIPLDEGGHARMYGGRIPGKPFEIVKLTTGAHAELLDKIVRIKAHAAEQAKAGAKPVVLILDSVSGVWSGLHDWVNARHRETRKARAILRDDPNADVGRAGRNLWNDADARWRALVKELKTFPGLVILTARGKEISATDESGQPAVDPRTRLPIKDWSVEVKRGFTYYVDVWLRKRREEGSFVVSVRSVEHGKKPGTEEAKKADPILDAKAEGRELEWLLFDVLGLDPATAYVNEFIESNAGGYTEGELAAMEEAHRSEDSPVSRQQTSRQRAGQRRTRTPEEWSKAVAEAPTRDRLNELHTEATTLGQLTQGLLDAMKARAPELDKPADVSELVAPVTEAITAQASDPDEAAVEAMLAEAEHRGMLVDELNMIGGILGHPVATITARTLPEGTEDAEIAKLQKVVANLRPMTIKMLQQQKRKAEAGAYAKVKDDEYDTEANLLGHEPTPADEANEANEADKADKAA